MDVSLSIPDIYDYIHLLTVEDANEHPEAQLSDIMLEQRGGEFYKTRFIEALSTKLSVDPDHPNKDNVSGDIADHEKEWNEKFLSVYLSAIALDMMPEKILLNEQQQYYDECISSDQKWIQLYLDCCTDEYKRKLIELKKSINKYSKIYYIEHSQVADQVNRMSTSNSSHSFHAVDPMYELEDVMIKSSMQVNDANTIDFDLFQNNVKTQDMYLPQTAQAKSFCQLADKTYLVTKSTSESPLMLEEKLDADSMHSTKQYNMQLESGKLSAVCYASKSELNVSAYAHHLSSIENCNSFFDIKNSIPNAQYSYLLKMPMTSITQYNDTTLYDNGNAYANIYNTKSMYNSLYSMDMPVSSQVRNCRDYGSIFECSGKLYLKYNDNVQYDSSSDHNQKQLTATYSKVESIQFPTSRSNKLHKSYFFSVDIKDISRKDLSCNESNIEPGKKSIDKLKSDIKHDITEAIKHIVDNVCPVQTQLFEVQFGGEA